MGLSAGGEPRLCARSFPLPGVAWFRLQIGSRPLHSRKFDDRLGAHRRSRVPKKPWIFHGSSGSIAAPRTGAVGASSANRGRTFMKGQSKLRLAALLALVLGVLAALGARAARPAADHKTAGGIIVNGTTDSVTNIDPAGNYDFGSGTLDYQIFQHLLEAGPRGLTPHPVLATKCGFQGHLKTFACTLRKGVKFHNAKPFTSADVVWSFDRVVRIKDPSGIYTLLSNLKSVKAKGKYGVVFNLKAPQATWPQVLTTGAAQIVSKSSYPLKRLRSNTAKQAGTGPYELSKFSPGQQAVLKKFKGYWGKPAANDGVIIRYYSKSSTMKLALTRKDIDMAFRDFTPTELQSLQKTSGIKVLKGSGASIRYLVLNVNEFPTDRLPGRPEGAHLMTRPAIPDRA